MACTVWKIVYLVSLVLSSCMTAHAGIILRDIGTDEEISSSYVVPILELIGVQNGSVTNYPAKVMSVQRNKEWCDNLRKSQDDPLSDFRDSALIMPFYDGLGTGDECNGDAGTWISMEGIGKLCNKSSIVLTVFRPGVFPGLFAKSRVGDHFESLKAKYGGKLEQCMVLVFELSNEEERRFIFDNGRDFEMNVTIDRSVAIEMFDSPLVQVALRGFLSIVAFFTILRAMTLIRVRIKVKKLEGVHSFLLFSNLLLMLVFGTFQAMGTDFITSNVPYEVHLGLFFLGNGTQVASLYVLALMYHNLLQSSKQPTEIKRRLSVGRISFVQPKKSRKNIPVRHSVYRAIASFLCIMDFMVLFANFSKLASTKFTYVVAPSVALSLQILAVGFLFHQVKEMVSLLKQGNEYQAKGAELSKTTLLHLQLSFWMKWTVFFSFLSTISRLVFLFGFALYSPAVSIATAFTYKLGVIGGSLSQVESTKLPHASRQLSIVRGSKLRKASVVAAS